MADDREPTTSPDLRGLLLDYLDFYREVVVTKLQGMPDPDLSASRLPSGWSPLQLLNHLVFMERRWFEWGLLGEQVDEPWGDWDGKQWAVPQASASELAERLHAQGRRTRAIVEAHQLDDRASERGRFTDETAPHLHWILLHVLQEYARHAGHLDIVRELSDADLRP